MTITNKLRTEIRKGSPMADSLVKVLLLQVSYVFYAGFCPDQQLESQTTAFLYRGVLDYDRSHCYQLFLPDAPDKAKRRHRSLYDAFVVIFLRFAIII